MDLGLVIWSDDVGYSNAKDAFYTVAEHLFSYDKQVVPSLRRWCSGASVCKVKHLMDEQMSALLK